MKKKEKRICSLILSSVMIIGLLWAVPGDGNAAASIADEGAGKKKITINDTVIWGNSTEIELDNDGGTLKDKTKLDVIDVNPDSFLGIGDSTEVAYVGNEGTEVKVYEGGSVVVGDSSTLECKSYSGELKNNGTLTCNSFSGSVKNHGEINCLGSFNGSIYNGDVEVPEAVFRAGSFTSSGENLIYNYGTMTIDGTFDASGCTETFINESAIYANSIIIGKVTDSDSSEYNVSESIDLGDGVKGMVKAAPTTIIKANSNKKFDLYINGVQVSSEKVGFDSSNGGECYAYEFLPPVDPESYNFDKDEDGNYLTFTGSGDDEIHSGYGDEKVYVKNTINLSAQSGYKVKFGDGEFSDHVTIDKDTYENNIKDTESEFKIYSESDYRIGPVKAIQANSNINNIVFDNELPKITASFVADGKTINSSSDEIEAQELTVTITANDTNLNPEVAYKIGEDSKEEIKELKTDGSSYKETFTINAEPGKPKDCKFSVSDKSGNTSSVNFKLVFAKKEYSATVSMNDYIMYGESLTPTTNYLGGTWNGADPYYEYSSDGGKSFSATEPKTTGDYMVRAVLTGSDSFYDFTTDAVSFEIKRLDIKDFRFTVAPLTLENGEVDNSKYEFIWSDLPEWIITGGEQEKIVVEFKKEKDGDAAYTKEYPSTPGTYVARVTLPQTPKYNSVSGVSDPFEISKTKLTMVSLNGVDDIEAGGKFTPHLSRDSTFDGKITYKYKLANETEYGDTEIEEGALISDAGEYTAKAFLNESNIYEDAESNEVSFKVTKKNITLELSAADVFVGETVSPKIVSPITFDPELDVDIQYVYKGKGEGETAYTSEVPVKIGDYTVKAILTGSKRYNDTSATASFTIKKIDENTAIVEVPDTVVGTDYEPVLTTMSDGKSSAKFEYKLANADDSAYSETKPTEPGKYVIRATVPATDKYEEQVCTDEFTISEVENPDQEENKEEDKQEEKSEDNLMTAIASVEVPNVYVGVTYDPILTTDSDGKDKTVFEYKSADDEESEFSSDKPDKAGKYIVRATVPETATYHEVTCESTFTISKITSKESTVKIIDTYVGAKIIPLLISDSDGKADAVFEYKKDSDKESEYSKTEPSKAGKYSVRATIPETDKYLKVVCESTFTIEKKTPTATVKLDDQIAGTKDYKPALSTDSDGKSKAHFEYKSKDATDDDYSDKKPTIAGDYVVRATIPETDRYKKATCETEFSLIYLKDDSITYKVTGESGKNGFYVSDVYLVAPNGYEISASRDGIYSKRIKYSTDIKKVYLRRKSDGAQAEEIVINNEIKVDKDSPKLVKVVDENNEIVELSGSNDLYADKLTLSFEDEHIISIKVNGQFDAPNDKNITVTLDAEGGEKFYEIVVEDLAGNKYSSSITLNAAWMKDNTLPSGLKVKLKSGNGYTLKSGSWKVDGDATVYSGGRTVYVNSDGDYTFVEQ